MYNIKHIKAIKSNNFLLKKQQLFM